MEETTIKPEDLENIEVGGESYVNVELHTEKKVYEVTDVNGYKTKFGNKIVFRILDMNGFAYLLSNWNFISKDKFKPLDLLGLKIRLSPIKSNTKKLLLEIM